MNHSTPGLPVHHHLPEFTQMSIESVMPSSHLILGHPLLLLPPIPPSIKVFESTLRMRWPKYWSFSFSISPSNEHPGLNSFSMDWLDLLAVQGTLKSLLPVTGVQIVTYSFKGYILFVVIIKYWLYSLSHTIYIIHSNLYLLVPFP